MAEVVEDFRVADGAGEVAQVLLHKVACLIVCVRVAIVDVVVPIEACLVFSLYEAHHGVLHAVQHVEASEDDGAFAVEQLLDEAFVSLHCLRDVAEECAFPQLPFGQEALVELRIDLVHVAPCVEELLLKPSAVLQREASEEALQRLALVLIEVVQVLETLVVGDVGEDGLRVCQVLVDVVEVSHQHLSPAPELVNCLCVVGPQHLLHDAEELADALQRVCHLYGRESLEEVAHRAVGWCPDRLVAEKGELAAEEHAGTLAWEDNRDVAHVIREVRQHVGCYETKETLHLAQVFLCCYHIDRCKVTNKRAYMQIRLR